MTIRRYGGRYWAVFDASGTLVCVYLDKEGAQEVVRRLTSQEQWRQREHGPRGEGTHTLLPSVALVQQQGEGRLWTRPRSRHARDSDSEDGQSPQVLN